MELTGYARDKDCRSPADNDKAHIKSELLFAPQPGLVATLINVPFPLIFSTETARRSCRNLNFFQKTTANMSCNARDIIECGHHLTIMRRRAGMTTQQEQVEIWFKNFLPTDVQLG